MINKKYARDLILDLCAEGESLSTIAEMLELPIETIIDLIKEN
jgi:hypothetical protein